jgi:uncharacterized Tic20 family protein
MKEILQNQRSITVFVLISRLKIFCVCLLATPYAALLNALSFVAKQYQNIPLSAILSPNYTAADLGAAQGW